MQEPSGPHDPNGKIVTALLEACPSVVPEWRAYMATSSARGGVYSDLGTFAHHLVSLLERGELSEFPALFAAVEGLLASQDDGVRYAVKIGLLEDLGNIAANRRGWSWTAQFRGWFGPATAAAWAELHRDSGTSDSG